jgi:hemoglobin/transferrin/lactoferrin receptor protein
MRQPLPGLLFFLSLALAVVPPSARSQSPSAPPTALSGGSEVALPPLPVSGQGEQALPGPTSSVSNSQLQEVPLTATGDMLIGIPGVFFQNTGAPGLAVSVRGLQDFGRVNVTIDGARQDFMVSGHGANSSVYVDPALLAGIDVSRGTVSTANGAGAIGGVISLRTLGIEDVVRPEAQWGALTTDLFGTNGYDGSGMLAVGARINPQVDVVGAVSVRSSGNYHDGDGNLVDNSGQHLQSGLIKTDIVPGVDQTLQLGAIFYHNTFGTDAEGLTLEDTVESTTTTASYHWAPSANPLISLHAEGAYTGTRFDDLSPAFVGVTLAPADNTHYKLNTFGGEIDNTSIMGFGTSSLAINYGAESYSDAETTLDTTGDASLTPSGHRNVSSGFTQATLNVSAFQIIGAVRYDSYSLTGTGFNESGGITALPAGPFSIDRSASAASPKVTLAFNPIASLQLYGSYGLGFRPPALTETLMSGAHPGLEFLRFIPNPELDPERTHGWEVGGRYASSNLATEGDSLTLKADYFSTRIRNYIDQTLIPTNTPDSSTGIPIDGYFYQNLAGTTLTHGMELEGQYDRHVFFARVAYSNITTQLGTSDYTGFDAIITAPPRSVFTGTLGLRLLSERLVIGARTRAVSRTTGQPSPETGTATTVPGYVVEDLFGSYQATHALKFFASIENVGDREYFEDALATVASPGILAKIGVTLAVGP